MTPACLLTQCKESQQRVAAKSRSARSRQRRSGLANAGVRTKNAAAPGFHDRRKAVIYRTPGTRWVGGGQSLDLRLTELLNANNKADINHANSWPNCELLLHAWRPLSVPDGIEPRGRNSTDACRLPG